MRSQMLYTRGSFEICQERLFVKQRRKHRWSSYLLVALTELRKNIITHIVPRKNTQNFIFAWIIHTKLPEERTLTNTQNPLPEERTLTNTQNLCELGSWLGRNFLSAPATQASNPHPICPPPQFALFPSQTCRCVAENSCNVSHRWWQFIQ